MRNVIILGSGRSGTSMTAGLFPKAGYYLGDNYLGKNKSNPKGFFEDREVNQINEAIIDSVVPTYPEIIRKWLFPSVPFYNARWLARVKPGKKLKSNRKIEERITERLENTPFCYKDPRFSYTLPVWMPHFDDHTVSICVFREPINTAKSIVKECNDSKALHPLKMNERIALSVWSLMYQHILNAYKYDANKDRWLFVHFDQILSGQALNKIEEFTGAKIDFTFPEKKINRTRLNNIIQSDKLNTIYSDFCKLSRYSV